MKFVLWEIGISAHYQKCIEIIFMRKMYYLVHINTDYCKKSIDSGHVELLIFNIEK